MDDLNRIRRYELKYVVSEDKARRIRDFIQPIFSLDKHVPPGEAGYTVNNLYLDTPELRFYQDVKLRKLRRRKPRVRYYGAAPDELIWLEVKNREDSVIWKHRRAAPVADWPGLLDEPREPDAGGGVEPLLRSFEDVVQLTGAYPVLHVRYLREPWVSDIDDYGRVTFDRYLRCHLARGSTELATPDAAMSFYDDAITAKESESLVILEIKVERRVPLWALTIIRRFELVQRGWSKYCYVLDNAREAGLGRRRQPAWA